MSFTSGTTRPPLFPLAVLVAAIGFDFGAGVLLDAVAASNDIVLAPEAVEDLDELRASNRAEVEDALERHLRHEPTKTSKTRIKRLCGLAHPQFRLRVGEDLRVFYDVVEEVVEVLAIVAKSEANDWLEEFGESDEKSHPDKTQGSKYLRLAERL